MATSAVDTPRPYVARVRVRAEIDGVVQGVGFRPFVHRLATELGLTGFVGNDSTAVFVEVEGSAGAVDEFLARVRTDAPPLALVLSVRATTVQPESRDGRPAPGFRIVPSRVADGARTLMPPDTAVCDDCVRELFDPADRRYRHPFITCTNCGPRFTIIRTLPYDRPATTMAGFPMCRSCAGEYADPADRRFHAQPVACNDCGPSLWYEDTAAVLGEPGVATRGTDAALGAAQTMLAGGGVVAVKGIGGYHLACDAASDDAVAQLRSRKHRPDKPLAVMVPDLATARMVAHVDEREAFLLSSPAHPIVLVRRREDTEALSPLVAPGNPRLGLLLPYTPLHHLLLSPCPGGPSPDRLRRVLVVTSGNRTDEPICYADGDARRRLGPLADGFLLHDRPIHVPCDDSVLQVAAAATLPVRRSRGYAPLPVDLGTPVRSVQATGGELKNTSCVTAGRFAFLSQHLGDMGALETVQELGRAGAHLAELCAADVVALATDLHPGYVTGAWARRNAAGRPLVRVQHHHAHVVSLLAEHGRLGRPVVGVAFDGTGYGPDGSVWGGELLVVGEDPRVFERAGHLRPLPLPGGDAAVRRPSRVALAYLRACGVDWDPALPPVAASAPWELEVLRQQLDRGVACVPTSSAGRLFDAVASLLGVRQQVTFEAQAAVELQACAEAALRDGVEAATVPPAFALGPGQLLDPAPLLTWLAGEVVSGAGPGELALAFHRTVADAVVTASTQIAGARGIGVVGLTGGVFQNALLLGLCEDGLRRTGLEVLSHHVVPPNDGGLALGQAVVAALGDVDEEV